MLRRHLNFCQISHRFILSFVNPSFQYLKGSHIMYWNMIILNPSRFKVEPQSKYWYFCIERWDLLLLRFSENAVLFHIEWVCRKTAGNFNWSPYRYTAVTHWTCPPSSGRSQTSYTAPYNGVVSHGAQIGCLQDFTDHMQKQTQNKCIHYFRVPCHGVFYACLSSGSDRSRCRWHTHLTNYGYFDYEGKNPDTPPPQFERHAGIKMAQVLGSPLRNDA